MNTNLAVSPKVTAASVGAALASILWILLPAFSETVEANLDQAAVGGLTAATSAVFAAVLGYLVVDPQRDLGLKVTRDLLSK